MSEIVRVQLSWSATDIARKLPPEEYKKLRAVLPRMDELPEDQAGITHMSYKDICIYSEDIDFLLGLGITFELKGWKSAYRPFGKEASAPGNIVHVHLPNLGLLMMDEVTNLDDACTDNLQRHLDNGWRIIAICPPNGQRRPDYILGRTKSKE